MTDMISDMMTRIRNGQMRKLLSVNIPYSSFKEKILSIMQEEGYIKSYEKLEGEKPDLVVSLKYLKDGLPVIQEIKRISRPGKRVYSCCKELRGCYNNFGIKIISTPKGVLSNAKAKSLGVGGEIICQLF